MRFGTNLQFIRRQRGMTQEELAAKLGVSRQAVSKWESDGALPELEKLAALCGLFGCTMDGLLRGDLAAIRLLVICLVVAAVVSLVNEVTKARYAEIQKEEQQKAMASIFGSIRTMRLPSTTTGLFS